MSIKGILGLVAYGVAGYLAISGISIALRWYNIDVKSFWLGFGSLALFGFTLGVYFFMDNLGYSDKIGKKMQKWGIWKPR